MTVIVRAGMKQVLVPHQACFNIQGQNQSKDVSLLGCLCTKASSTRSIIL